MADHFLTALGCIRRALARSTDPAADATLLDRFVRDRDESAFTELVARHGPVVWAACRRAAPTTADAEDALQATFFVLARRATRVRRAAAVGGWLFRVAVRLAARTRPRAGRLAGPVAPAADPNPGPSDQAAWQDLVAVLDAEVAALPETLRAAIVCCYYEGLTQDEAARRLGWKVRTVRARVGRGRTVLQARLARRGLDLGAALAAAAVGTTGAARPPVVGPAIHAAGPVIGPPARAALVRDGLALTGSPARARAAVAAAVLATGVGIALAAGLGSPPADGDRGPALPGSPADAPAAAPRGSFLAVDPNAIYRRAVDGCVYIVRETDDGGVVEGSGALIDGDARLVLTTARVVGDRDVVSVQFPYHNEDGTVTTDRKEYAPSAASKISPMGRVIHRDAARDLALLRLDRLGRRARPLEFAEAGVRGTVLHIGSGTGELFPMAVRKVISGAAALVPVPRVVLSGATDDSGGPLVDRDGKLVGLVAGPAERPGTLAIDVSELRAFLADKDRAVAPPVTHASTEPPAEVVPENPGPPLPAARANFDAAGRELFEKRVTSTVYIVTPHKGGIREGSGALIDAEKRYVLTSCGVVDENEYVFGQFPAFGKDGALVTRKDTYLANIPENRAIRGRVLHRDRSRDLALVQLDRLPPATAAIPLARTGARPGERVINIGNSSRAGAVFTGGQGLVRTVGLSVFRTGAASEIRAAAVSVTNPIQPGDSGGPVLDRRGYQVAVTVTGPADGPQAVTQCIDVTEILAFLKERKVAISAGPDPVGEPEPRPKEGKRPPKMEPTPPDDEKAAARLLQYAELFRDGDQEVIYRRKLRELIDKYPATVAAKDAKKRLDVKR
ncbi:MAG TPA: sigma-70 family RNA polymerase sigma factor [Gemmataceae bacterium]|nr:sigma-70 family RNA polymerase sigma factor [Gemmataceae bacterium]